jgi:hypothetical protein
MNREEILHDLMENIREGLWVLAALKKAKKPVSKEKLGEATNAHYRQVWPDQPPLIPSRHALDILLARLEGGALVSRMEIGRNRMYSISRLGKEIILFREEQRRDK